MIRVEFDLNQIITTVQANLNEPFRDIVNKYLQKVDLQLESVYFIANGTTVNLEGTLESKMNNLNKENNTLKVIVNLIDSSNLEPQFYKSKDIICPECYEPCRVQIDNSSFTLYDCPNNHRTENIKRVYFQDTQMIDMSKIICDECKIKNMGNSYRNEMYRCLTCSKNICILCKAQHETMHASNRNIIKYEQKNHICSKHGGAFIKYCKQCKLNLCMNCREEHEGHATQHFEDISFKKSEIGDYISQIRNIVNKFDDDIKTIIGMIENLKDLISDIKLFYKINVDILTNYDLLNTNYMMLENIKEIINNNNLFKELKEINWMENMKDKFEKAISIYDRINLSQMTMLYKIDKNQEQIKLFADDDIYRSFIRDNKNKCYLLIDGKKHDLVDRLKLDENLKNKNTLEVKLIETKKITNMSLMFEFCSSLISLPDISYWDTKNVYNMSQMFRGCSSLISLPDISRWNTKKVYDMSQMFSGCSSLISIPDISKWDMKNVTNIHSMFDWCSSLKSLPDISKWNTNNIKAMHYLFEGCSSLISLPDISKWNMENVGYISYMFSNCSSLKSLPDISKWNTKNVIKMQNLFSDCCSLISLPDISKWDVKNAKEVGYMFYKCSSLKSYPDISKWDLNKDSDKGYLLAGSNYSIIPEKIQKKFRH